MIATVKSGLGEINDEDNFVLQGALHLFEQVPPTGHHTAHTDSSALTTTTGPNSRPQSSCSTSLPWTSLPPTALIMSPGPDSTTEEVSYDELHLLETGGLAPSSTAKTESVLTPRAISPVTDRLAVPPSQAAPRNHGSTMDSKLCGFLPNSKIAPTKIFSRTTGLVLLRLLLFLVMYGFPSDPGIKEISNQPMEFSANFNPVTIQLGTLPGGQNRSWLRDTTRDAVVFGYYYYEPGLPPISCTTVWPILQHLPNHAVVKEDVPVCHQVDHDMIITDTAELGEVNDGDNIVLQDSLHHLERVSTPGPYVHHMASVMCSAQTSITTPTSGSHSSCIAPLPWTIPLPTAIEMSPGSRSSCHSTDEQNCNERSSHKLREQFLLQP